MIATYEPPRHYSDRTAGYSFGNDNGMGTVFYVSGSASGATSTVWYIAANTNTGTVANIQPVENVDWAYLAETRRRSVAVDRRKFRLEAPRNQERGLPLLRPIPGRRESRARIRRDRRRALRRIA